MRRRVLSQPAGTLEAVNVTPMIDVVMCLIVFFLIVGKLAADTGGTVRLPGSAAGLAATRPPALTILVGPPEGAERPTRWGGVPARVLVDGRAVTDEAALETLLRERLATLEPGAPVQVRADRDMRYEAVEPVLRACGRAGLTNLRLATERVR
ncbi:MAG: biopolymer transporter ExbD [Phycisphaeraceae bacterium]|nr:biopolymer transporter ExbD [Phycisphaeraceae bacterium]